MSARIYGGFNIAMKVPPHQYEATLAFYRDDFPSAATHLAKAGVIRCDRIEPLPEGFRGGWFTHRKRTNTMKSFRVTLAAGILAAAMGSIAPAHSQDTSTQAAAANLTGCAISIFKSVNGVSIIA